MTEFDADRIRQLSIQGIIVACITLVIPGKPPLANYLALASILILVLLILVVYLKNKKSR